MGFIILFIGIVLVIIVMNVRQKLAAAEREEWEYSLKELLEKEGINRDDKDMYEYQGKVPGVEFEEIVINCMKGNQCIGKKWYRKERGVWNFYKYRDSEAIWYERLDAWGYTPEEGIGLCKVGCMHTNRTWEEEKNYLITSYFPEEWFAAYEYFKYLHERSRQRFGS